MHQRAVAVRRGIRVRRQHAAAVGRNVDVEAALAAAVADARRVVAAHVRGQRDVAIRARAHQIRRQPQRVELGRAERLDDLRARFRGLAPRQQTASLAAPRLVGVVGPPQHALAAGLEHLGRAAGRAEADVHRQLPRGDVGVHAVEHAASGLVLVEAQVQEAAQVVARLRVALRDRVANRRAERAGGRALPKERDQVARGREADAVHRRILGDVGQLVERRRIEPTLEAQLLRVRVAGERRLGAVRERPFVGAKRNPAALLGQPPRQASPWSCRGSRASPCR